MNSSSLLGRFSTSAVFNRRCEIFGGGLSVEKGRLKRLKRRTLAVVLEDFRHTTEARAVDAFWVTRKKGVLITRPEKIAQLALVQYFSGVITQRGGLLFQQFKSGIGWVDVGIVLSSSLHLIELKVLTGKFTGASQLEKYMISERKKRGYLVVFDARPPTKKTSIPTTIVTSAGVINVLVVDINPPAPSSLSK
jgi:hypothetical protein